MLHASDPGAPGKPKIEPFVNTLTTNFQKHFYPYENLSLDEMVIGWTGRFGSKQYNPKRPEKYHIKTFGLCDSITGYCLNLLVYFGQDTSFVVDPETEDYGSQAVKVFDTLLRYLRGGRHHVYAE